MSVTFILSSVLFGVGLAMDAMSVSMANGLNEPNMKKSKMFGIAGVFALFQTIMPLIGWACVHTVAEAFVAFQRFIPWIALLLLAYIGGKMLYEGLRGGDEPEEPPAVGLYALMVQGVATSIDALSVGFTIADCTLAEALAESLIIGAVTYVICFCGLMVGRVFGTRLAGKASVLGGAILIAIGLEIFITGVL